MAVAVCALGGKSFGDPAGGAKMVDKKKAG